MAHILNRWVALRIFAKLNIKATISVGIFNKEKAQVEAFSEYCVTPFYIDVTIVKL